MSSQFRLLGFAQSNYRPNGRWRIGAVDFIFFTAQSSNIDDGIPDATKVIFGFHSIGVVCVMLGGQGVLHLKNTLGA